MKAYWTLALAGLGLALAPASAQASKKDVDFSGAIACSALFSVLAASVDGAPEYYEFVDVSARWLVIATSRDNRSEVIG